MTFSEFRHSLNQSHPPENLSVYLQSLWFDGKGDWQKAHSMVDSLTGGEAALTHAYLHRKEGDIANADYWYSRAAQPRPSLGLEQEWQMLVKRFLSVKN